jgi:hypothetical protein
MIEIILLANSKTIIVDDSLSVELNSNLFTDELITANFTLPFEVPATAENLAALNFPFMLDATARKEALDATLLIAGALSWKGKLKVLEASRTSIKCTFQLAASALADKLQEKINVVNGVRIDYDFGLRSSMWKYIVPNPMPPNPFTEPIINFGDRFGFELFYGVGESSSNAYYLTVKQEWDDQGYKMFADLCRRINNKVDIPYVENPLEYEHEAGKFYKTYEVPGDTNFYWYKAQINGPITIGSFVQDLFLGFSPADVSAAAFETAMDGSQYYLDPTLVPVCDLVAIPFFKNGVAWIILFELEINSRKVNIPDSFNRLIDPNSGASNNAFLVNHDDDSIIGGGGENFAYRLSAGAQSYFEASNDRLIDVLPTGLIPQLDNPDLAYFPVYNPAGIDNESFADLDFPAYRGYVNYNGIQDLVYTSGFPRIPNLLKKQFEYLGIELTQNAFDLAFVGTIGYVGDLAKVVLYNPVLDEMPLSQNNSGFYREAVSLALSSKLPNVSVEEFLNAIRKLFFLYVDFHPTLTSAKIWPLKTLFSDSAKANAWDWNGKITRIVNVKLPTLEGFKVSFAFDYSDELTREFVPNIDKEFLLDPVQDVADLDPEARIGSFALVLSLNRFYNQALLEDNTVQWIAGPLNYKPIEIDQAKNDYSLGASSTFVYDGIDTVFTADFPSAPTAKTWRVPFVKQPLYSEFFNQKNDFAVRFLFKGGAVDDNLGNEYILGSPDGITPESELTTDFQMNYDPEKGIVKQLGTEYLNLLDKGKIVTVEALLSIGDLTLVKMDRLITYENRYFLIRKFNIELPIRDVAKLELFMLPY